MKVPELRWHEAQSFERGYWTGQQRPVVLRAIRRAARLMVCDRPTLRAVVEHRDSHFYGDDSNYWWLEKFGSYAEIPSRTPNALEVGCGPQTNLRLIARHTRTSRLYGTDPLMPTYLQLAGSWVRSMHRAGKLEVRKDKAESLSFSDDSMHLLACINVLDHCQDAEAAIQEMHRVLVPNGCFVLGVELTNEEDMKVVGDDPGHPLRFTHDAMDALVLPRFQVIRRKVLPREESRIPSFHYGTYIFIGRKLEVTSS